MVTRIDRALRMLEMTTIKKSVSVPNITQNKATSCLRCEIEGKIINAEKQCSECSETLCGPCSTEHEKEHRKANTMMDIKHQKMQTKTPLTCFDHNEKIERFCTNHDQLICSVCILTSHFDCSTMTIPEAAKGIRGSRETTLAVDNLQKLKTKFESIINDKKLCLQTIQDQDKEFNLGVRTFRATIIGILNKCDKEIMAKKDAFVKAKKTEITGQLETCKKSASILDNACKELDKTFLGPSDDDVFLSTKKSRAIVKKHQKTCSTMDRTPKRVVFSFLPNGTLEKFFANCHDIGTMKLDQASSETLKSAVQKKENVNLQHDAQLVPAGRKESSWAPRNQTMVLYEEVKQVPGRVIGSRSTRRPLPVAEINVYFEDDEEVAFVTGVEFLPDEQLVIVDEKNRCMKLFNVKFQPVIRLKLTSSPRDISSVGNNIAAVTLPHEKTIQFVYVGKTMEATKRVQVDIECSGITFYENELYITSGFAANREIQILSLDGKLRKRIKPGIVDLRYPLYIVVEPRMKIMFVSDYNHGVVGIDMRGFVKFKCQETDIHNYYKGIALSNHGHLYVCTWQMNGVSRVHTDGRGLETIIPMPEKGGLKPYAIGYSKRSKTVVVSLCGKNRGYMSVYKFSS